jgi:hypothetical protein
MQSFSRKPNYSTYALAGMLALFTILITFSPVYLDDISVLLADFMNKTLR